MSSVLCRRVDIGSNNEVQVRLIEQLIHYLINCVKGSNMVDVLSYMKDDRGVMSVNGSSSRL